MEELLSCGAGVVVCRQARQKRSTHQTERIKNILMDADGIDVTRCCDLK